MSMACLRSTRGVCLLVVQQYVGVGIDASVRGLRYSACLINIADTRGGTE